MNHTFKIADSERRLWTELDFENMSWHDSKIHAIAFGLEEYELAFDIDYILEWISPKEDEINYKFLVVPATLVFRNAYDLNISFSLLNITIDDIYRDNPTIPKNASYLTEQMEYDWIIDTNNGQITLKSVGYTQFSRQAPRLLESQSIELVERQGISFAVCP